MPGTAGALAIEGVELGIGDEQAVPRCDVSRACRVPFPENEPIPRPEELMMQEHRRFEGGKVAAEITDTRGVVHCDEPPAPQSRQAVFHYAASSLPAVPVS